jgi:hypothetical protein
LSLGDHLSLQLRRELESNPPVKYPQIHVAFGNTPAGILNLSAARDLTERMFKEYGVALQPNLRVQGPGYDFVADGYDSNLKIGYKILPMPGSEKEIRRLEIGFLNSDDSFGDLSSAELQALDQALGRGDLQMLVVERSRFVGFKSAEAFYLASVIDYLNWVHGDREIAMDSVLGKRIEEKP